MYSPRRKNPGALCRASTRRGMSVSSRTLRPVARERGERCRELSAGASRSRQGTRRPSRQILGVLQSLGVYVTSPSSTISPADARRLREHFTGKPAPARSQAEHRPLRQHRENIDADRPDAGAAGSEAGVRPICPTQWGRADIKFAQSARKHRIGRAHVLHVIETAPYTRYPAHRRPRCPHRMGRARRP